MKKLLATFICAFAALATLVASAFDTPYLTFRSETSFSLQVGTGTTGGWNGTMEYSTDAVNWATWDGTVITAGDSGSDYRLYLRGTGNKTITAASSSKYWMFPTGSDIYCEGDIETLRQYDGTAPAMNANCYYGLFKSCTKLKSAPTLSATTLTTSCYNSMFKGCTSLTAAPALPATTLQNQCYREMFSGCTSLESAGPIGATSTAQECCYQMFYDCKALTNAPSLPATTLAASCYSSMFSGCKALTTAPEIDATIVASQCCQNMFKGCTALTNAPVLHAETLATFCYQSMFEGCTALVKVPDLTATTLAQTCYKDMFKGCTSLTVAPAITATTLAIQCCDNMFYNCTKLTTVPDFPAVPLANNCYYAMFYNCTSLVEPPALPATELANNCYQLMFLNCTSLISLPKLNATTVPNYAYNGMFQGCSKLEISTTLTPGKKTWKLPAGLVGGSNWNASMFHQTKNWANGTTGPQAGITYYILSKDSTELSQSANEFNAWTGDTISVNLASTIVGGSMTYVFSGLTGAPAGVTLNGSTLSATIATAGTYDFTVYVEDTSSTPLTLDAEYRIIVTDPDPITAPGANLGKARVGKEKSYTLADTVAGGVAPYTFTLKSGLIPGGYTLVDGVLSGTATEDKTNTFILTITDKLNVSQDIEYTLVTYTPVGIKDDDPDEPETGDTIEYFNGDDTFSRTCTKINAASTVVTWEDSWYYVTGSVTLSKGAIVNGKVSLILCDGATLMINGDSGRAGIHVVVDGGTTNTLTIYGQAEGTGKLKSYGAYNCAGIGGGNKGDVNTGTGLCNCGKVNIYGGVIEAYNSSEAAAIGGGRYGSGGTITIYGGDVKAVCNSYASGIGGASPSGNGAGGNVTVYGGRVSANAGTPSYAGIGSYNGSNRPQGTLTVGPNVKVKADNSNPPTTVLPRGAGGVIDLGTGANRMYFLLEESGPDPLDRTGSGTLQVYDNEAVNWNIAETIIGGTDPYTLSASNLPDGLSMSDGVISGSVATVGEYPITVEVTDSTSPAMETNFVYTLTVTYAPKAITYKDGDATLVGLEPAQYSPGTATQLAPSAEKTGYTFGGWYDNAGLQGDAVTAISAEATTPQTFWAKWTPVEYTVTYMDGGTPITDQGLTPTSFTIESATLALPATATKAGKGFYGWYDNSDCLGSAVTTIPAGTHENKTFWAKWGAVKSNETYVNAAGAEQPQVECVQVDAGTTELTTGWYVVNGTVEISAGLTVSGDVKLILADGATLTVTAGSDKAGISVATGNSLTIYCQTLGTGRLSATGGYQGAGIGGDNSRTCGNVTINGGTVSAVGGTYGAGIGGGKNGAGGTVTINGGNVRAIAQDYCIGVGGGYQGNGGAVYVYGGSLVANSQYRGIGGGLSSHGTLTVGDDIVVKAGSSEDAARQSTALAHGEEGAIDIATARAWYVIEVYVPDPLDRTGDVALQVYANQAVEWDVGSGITGGTPPYALASANLPQGLQLANGILSGSVATVGEYPITVTVTDSTSPAMVTNFVYTLTVVAPDPIVTSTTDLGTAKVGVEKSFAISELISGGAGTLTFALVGDAPAGFTFTAATGVLSGTATATGPLSVTISAMDMVGNSQTFTYSFEAVQTGAVDDGEPAESGSGAYTTYVAADGNERGRMCNLVTSSDAAVTWESGWYYVTGDVTLSAGAVVNGYVCLILGDGATLTVTQSDNDKAGINVGFGKTLAIYGQTVSSGSVSATGGYYGAGIGGNKSQAGGTFKVYGGRVEAYTEGTDSYSATGIGKGYGNGYSKGDLYVYGDVVAQAGYSATSSLTTIIPEANHLVYIGAQKYFLVEKVVSTPLTAETDLGTVDKGDRNFGVNLKNKVSGGIKPYSFAQKEGSALPAGLSLKADGVLSGTPTAAGNFSFWITVTDSSSTPQVEDFEFALKVNEIYSIIYYETNGTTRVFPSPAIYEYAEGTGLAEMPVPTKTGYNFVSWHTDTALESAPVTSISSSETGNKTFYAKWAPLNYTITYIDGEDGTTVLSGLAPATYTIESGATLPTAADKAGYMLLGWYATYPFYSWQTSVTTIPVGEHTNKTFYAKWFELGQPLAMAEHGNELYADAGDEAGLNLKDTIVGGMIPYSFALKDEAGNALPAGLALDPDGTLSGTVAAAGVYTFKVIVTDSAEPDANTFEATYTLEVDLAKTTTDPLGVDATLWLGHPANVDLSLAIVGGTAPYSFELVDGELPDGLVLNGKWLEGTPTMTGDPHFTLNVTDANGVSTELRYWIYVRASTDQQHFSINGINWGWVSATTPKQQGGQSRISIWNGGANAIPVATAGSVYVPSSIGALTEPVTCVGSGAFSNCTAITRVTLPDTILDIGKNAFYGCSALREVIVRADVEHINTNAFFGCSNLNRIYVESGDEDRVRALVASSGCDASGIVFVGCTFNTVTLDVNLGTELEMPVLTKAYTESAYLPTVGNLPVPTRYNYSFDGWYTEKLGGTLIEEDGKLAGCDWTLYAHWTSTLPDPVFTVNGQGVLTGVELNGNTEITIPDTVTSIGNMAIYNKDTLRRVTIPGSVVSIGSVAISECDNLREIVLSEGLETIGHSAFSRNVNLESVTIPGSVSLIDDFAFSWCSNLVDLVICESDVDLTIGDTAFGYCTSLTCDEQEGLYIPDRVVSIGSAAFHSVGLKKASLPGSLYSEGAPASAAFSSVNLLDTVLVSYRTNAPIFEIVNGSLRSVQLNGNTDIVIPDGVTEIYYGAFEGLSEMTSVTIPNTVRIIHSAFKGCSGLTDVTIPSSVTNIGLYAFQDCTGLSSITIPSSVVRIGGGAFQGCTSLREVVIPDSVVSMDNAFQGCSALMRVVLGDGLTEIPAYAFRDCSSLTNVTLGANLSVIGYSAFANCAALKDVVFPDSLTQINYNAFEGCSSIAELVIPANVFVDFDAFKGCTALTSLALKSGATIDSFVFEDCTALAQVTVEDRATIGSFAFRNCSRLANVTIGKGATLERYAFSRCTGLKSVNISGTEVSPKRRLLAASGRTRLLGAEPDPDATSVGDYAFFGCSGLESAVIGSKVSEIGGGAFGGCTRLRSITVESGNANYETVDGMLLTANRTKLISGAGDDKGVTVPEGVTEIEEGAFAGFGNITSVTLPNTVTTIGEAAFSNCTALATITIPSSVTSIGSKAFYDTAIKTVCISSGDGTRMSGLVSGTGYDTTGVTFFDLTAAVPSVDKPLEEADNGLPNWQNYVLGQDSEEPVKVEGVSAATESSVTIASTLKTPTASTGFTVKYSIDQVSADGAVVSEGEQQTSAALSIDLESITTNAFFAMKATIINDETGAEVPVATENVIGVMVVTNAPATTIIGVPFKSLSDDGSISVSELVHTANLSDGDELKAMDADGKLHSWTLANGVWEPAYVSGGTGTELSEDAGKIRLARGKGVWLTRKDPTKPIYFVGEASDESAETELDVATDKSPKAWNIVAPPSVEPVKLNEVFTENDGSSIQVPPAKDGGIPRNYTFKNGKWGYDGSENGIPKRIEADTLPPGRGFWYINRSKDPNKKINW